MTLTFDTHLASLNHLVECMNASTNFEIRGCNSFKKKIVFNVSHTKALQN